MQALISIDDTDSRDSLGSGSLAELLTKALFSSRLISRYSSITRHQLFVDDSIPYTSHNSSMCFSIEAKEKQIVDIINFAGAYLADESDPGSDPGLCVATGVNDRSKSSLVDFGLKAKRQVLTKKDAFECAKNSQVHLSEHGGSGCGVIGALAGIGLRLSGNDGRFRGWLSLGRSGEVIKLKQLCSHPLIDGVVTTSCEDLPGETEILLAEDKVKTVFLAQRQVLPVARINGNGSPIWSTLTRNEIKRF